MSFNDQARFRRPPSPLLGERERDVSRPLQAAHITPAGVVEQLSTPGVAQPVDTVVVEDVSNDERQIPVLVARESDLEGAGLVRRYQELLGRRADRRIFAVGVLDV